MKINIKLIDCKKNFVFKNVKDIKIASAAELLFSYEMRGLKLRGSEMLVGIHVKDINAVDLTNTIWVSADFCFYLLEDVESFIIR